MAESPHRLASLDEFVSFSKWCQAEINRLIPQIGKDEGRPFGNDAAKSAIGELARKFADLGLAQFIGAFDPERFNVARLAVAELARFKGVIDEAIAAGKVGGAQTVDPVNKETSATKSHTIADGPTPPNIIRFKGKSAELEPIPWRLAEYMWARDSASISEVCEYVWGERRAERISDSRINSARGRVNSVLLELGVQWTTGRKSGHIRKM